MQKYCADDVFACYLMLFSATEIIKITPLCLPGPKLRGQGWRNTLRWLVQLEKWRPREQPEYPGQHTDSTLVNVGQRLVRSMPGNAGNADEGENGNYGQYCTPQKSDGGTQTRLLLLSAKMRSVTVMIAELIWPDECAAEQTVVMVIKKSSDMSKLSKSASQINE